MRGLLCQSFGNQGPGESSAKTKMAVNFENMDWEKMDGGELEGGECPRKVGEQTNESHDKKRPGGSV